MTTYIIAMSLSHTCSSMNLQKATMLHIVNQVKVGVVVGAYNYNITCHKQLMHWWTTLNLLQPPLEKINSILHIISSKPTAVFKATKFTMCKNDCVGIYVPLFLAAIFLQCFQ